MKSTMPAARPGRILRQGTRALLVLACILLLAACANPGARGGSGYPERPITVLVGFSAGSATDVLARSIVKEVERQTGWTVVVENKEGASGSVALGALKSQSDDGYTYLFSGGSLAFTAAGDIDQQSVEGVKVVAKQSTALAVLESSPYDTLDDLVRAAKSNSISVGLPGALNYNTADIHAFTKAAGVDVRWVPFNGGSELTTALLGGHADAAAASPSNFQGGVESGELRILAVTGSEPPPKAPDTPVFTDFGYDLEASQWYAFASRGGVPQAAQEEFVTAVDKAFQSDSVQGFFEEQGLQATDMDLEESRKFVAEEATSAEEISPTLTALFQGS